MQVGKGAVPIRMLPTYNDVMWCPSKIYHMQDDSSHQNKSWMDARANSCQKFAP